MTRHFLATLLALALTTSLRAEVTYLGMATIPGDATDLSGLTGQQPDGTPNNRLGSIGSGIAYTGHGNRYVMVDDRGPHDGAVGFACRFHTFEIVVTPGAEPVVKMTLKSTTMLRDEKSRQFVGATAGPFDLRLDAEGVRVSPNGTIYVSDEYGPHIGEFGFDGQLIRRLAVPKRFLAAHQGHSVADELPPHNTMGRQPNRGMEGLAISPRGDKLICLMQSPLIQDGAIDAQNKRIGINNRILEIDLKSGKTREFVYQLDGPHTSTCELLAINDHEFLALERDSHMSQEARHKRVYRIDISSAKDVSGRSFTRDGVATRDQAGGQVAVH
ncbi:MAG: esterase-like activity of phytase family protein [Gemmataceae bacterium]